MLVAPLSRELRVRRVIPTSGKLSFDQESGFMSPRTIAALAAFLLIGPPVAKAQAASAGLPPAGIAAQLESLARGRARLWAATAPVIRCAPAPLTERPTAAAEFARPPVLPLETAFLDAAAVKRTVAARER
jgi:hypothetical protein